MNIPTNLPIVILAIAVLLNMFIHFGNLDGFCPNSGICYDGKCQMYVDIYGGVGRSAEELSQLKTNKCACKGSKCGSIPCAAGQNRDRVCH